MCTFVVLDARLSSFPPSVGVPEQHMYTVASEINVPYGPSNGLLEWSVMNGACRKESVHVKLNFQTQSPMLARC